MFSETYWNEWVKLEEENYAIVNDKPVYKKKGYLHLDHRFWFPDLKDEIKAIIKSGLKISNVKEKRMEFYPFSPFLKLLLKTPRYRYQFEEGHYDLETKIRPICFAAHRDSLIMGYYSYSLTKLYENYIHRNHFDDVVLAYRSDLGLCNIQFAKEVFGHVKTKKTCSTVALDIKGYFDHIDHIILKEKWKQILNSELPEDQFLLFKILTKYSYITQKALLKKYKGPKKRDDVLPKRLMDIVPGTSILEKFKRLKNDQLIVTNDIPDSKTKRQRGIPQGSPMSALLSNIYLIDFDKDLKAKADSEGFIYRRYCDDILLICDTDTASELMDHVIEKISKEYYLTIQPSKVDLIDFHTNSKGKIRGFRRSRSTKAGRVTISKNPVATTQANEDKYYKPLQYLGFEYNGKNVTIRSSSLSRFFRKLNYRLTRTITMAYSPKTKSDQIFMRQIYERYTHLGRRNFLTYAFNASKENYQGGNKLLPGMDSPAIRKQVANHFSLLRAELAHKNVKWYSHKSKGKKKVTPKYFS